MAGTVTLTVRLGKPRGKSFVFNEPGSFLVGRGEGCDVRLGDEGRDPLISRHHCLVEINPPHVWVRDLGSLNGTYLNGRIIGRREAGEPPVASPEHAVEDGDEIWIGTTILAVEVSPEPAYREAPAGGPANHYQVA
jgi:pSer/pThr/pTyr-binding forkhead associated (FHA) protein